MDGLTTRNVTEQDLNECFAVESACYTSDGATREKILTRIRLFSEGFIVADFEGSIIGIINSGSTNSEDLTREEFKEMVGHDNNGKNMVIFSLAVLPEFRGQGVSRKLMEKFLEVSRMLKKEKILLICKSELIPYYEQFRFIYVGKSRSEHGGFSWHEMYLPLGPSVRGKERRVAK
jgi:ribosomal protein S18 acetylase RimI-like enzyme